MIFAMPLPYKQLQTKASTCKSLLAKGHRPLLCGQIQSHFESKSSIHLPRAFDGLRVARNQRLAAQFAGMELWKIAVKRTIL